MGFAGLRYFAAADEHEAGDGQCVLLVQIGPCFSEGVSTDFSASAYMLPGSTFDFSFFVPGLRKPEHREEFILQSDFAGSRVRILRLRVWGKLAMGMQMSACINIHHKVARRDGNLPWAP